MKLTPEPNLPDPDRFYEALIASLRDLGEEDAERMNAKLVLILANHIGDMDVLHEALSLARPRGSAVRS